MSTPHHFGCVADRPCPAGDRVEDLEAFARGEHHDESLVRHVDSCAACQAALADIDDDNRFLAEAAGHLAADHPAPATPPRCDEIPGYRIVERISHGGQGVVYKAVHRTTGRKVAIKMLLAGVLATPRQRRRFEREMEIVGNLRHPNIVTLYETDLIADGRPAFSMAYVRGLTIDAWSRQAGGGADALRERLRLMAAVCGAVQHAHQHGVIHRDLKPGNILIDDDDEPHVLDFGLAKLAGAARVDPTMTGEFLGSVAYASPEQVSGHPDHVDTRSDVYALGVILYEMLVGERPFPGEGSISDVLRTITEVDPPAPSTRGATCGDEIDTIVAKAMAKDPDRRYRSAGELRDDLLRYLAGEPIAAKRDRAWYVVRKTAQRHKAAVLAVSIAMVVLAGFAAGLVRENHAARTARALAETRRAEAEDTLRFVHGMFEAVTPEKGSADTGMLRRMIELAEAEIDGGEKPPALEASVRHLVGDLYTGIGEFALAESALARAVELRRRHLGDDDQATLQARHDRAVALVRVGRSDDAAIALRDVLDRRLVVLGASDPATLETMRRLASVLALTGRHDEAGQLYREALDRHREAFGDDDPRRIRTMGSFVVSLRRAGRLDEAEAAGRELVATCRRHFGEEHADTLAALESLATVVGHHEHGQAEAEALLRTVLAARRCRLGADHPKSVRTAHNLAYLLRLRGEAAESAAMFGELLVQRRRQQGDHHPYTLKAWWQWGMALSAAGDGAGAEAALIDALSPFRAGLVTSREGRVIAFVILRDLGRHQLADGRAAQAEIHLVEACTGLRDLLGDDDPETRAAADALAEAVHQSAPVTARIALSRANP